jgi:hypothetical protein
MVARSRALVTPIGDFAVAYARSLYDKNAQVPESDRVPEEEPFVVVPFPSEDNVNSEVFSYTVDTLAFPRREVSNGAGIRALITKVITDRQLLLDFANTKGAISPLEDSELAVESLHYPHQREGYLKFARAREAVSGAPLASDVRLILGLSGVAPPPGNNSRADAIGDYLDTLAFRGEDTSCAARERARTELTTIAKELSASPYAASCRTYVGASK